MSSKSIQAFTREFDLLSHFERISDPIYEEGFLAENHFCKPCTPNPYIYPLELGEKILRLSVVEPLTEKDKQLLIETRQALDDSPWSRWSEGNYDRHCISLEIPWYS